MKIHSILFQPLK